jgi:hypothetical protein
MSEPPPPYDTSTVVETVRAEIRDSAGAVVAYFGGPLIDLAGNVPAGGSYSIIEPLDARQWPPMTKAVDPLSEDPPP